MRKIYLSLLSVMSFTVFAQVGVNTNNPQGVFHIDGAKDNPVTGIPSTTQLTNDVIVTAAGNIGVGNSSPITRLDTRLNPGNVSPGGEGAIGIGETSLAASTAGAGAIRYNTGSGGVLEYSNGTLWNQLTSTVKKSIVTANKSSALTLNDDTVINIDNWTENQDVNNNFNPATGIFIAPRTGSYQVSFSFALDNVGGNYIANSWIEALIVINGGIRYSSLIPVAVNNASYAGANVSFGVLLNAGESLRPAIYQRSGSAKSLRILQSGYNNFSIVEL